MATNPFDPKSGDCECCDKVMVAVTYNSKGKMWMCDGCKSADDKAVAASVNTMIAESRQIDSTIQIKTDIFIAQTVPAIELRGAIDADENIPADQKDYTFAKECMTRFKHLQQVIFEKREELLKQENEMRMWQVNVQNTAGKLRAEYREQFKALDIQYQPVKPKTVKSPSNTSGKAKKSASRFNMAEIKAAAVKHNLTSDGIRSIMVAKNLNVEDAVKFLLELIKK